MELWLILALSSPFLYALSNVLDKFLMEKRVANCYALAPISGLCAFTFAITVLFLKPLENITNAQFLTAIILGFSMSLTYMIYYNTLTFEEVSRVVSIWYINPVLVLILSAIFLQERLPIWKYPAIILASTGAILMGLKKIETKIVMRKAFYFLLLNCTIAAIITTIQKHLLSDLTFWNLFTIQLLGLSSGLCLTLFFKTTRKHLKHTLKSIHYIFLTELLTVSGAITFLAAMSHSQASKVSAISSIQPLYVFLLTIVASFFMPKILKEELSTSTLKTKLIAITLIVTGTYVISI